MLKVVKEMDYWRQREFQAQGGGLKALDADTVHKWRTSIQDGLEDALALSDRRRRAEEGDVVSSKNAKVITPLPIQNRKANTSPLNEGETDEKSSKFFPIPRSREYLSKSDSVKNLTVETISRELRFVSKSPWRRPEPSEGANREGATGAAAIGES